MSLRLWIDPRALAEAEDAARWYEARTPGAGARLRREIDSVFDRITEHPDIYEALGGSFRRAFTRRFPFAVVYRVTPQEVQVIGILPTRADPLANAIVLASRRADLPGGG
ncbi:MAG TPA: type II toxin-antitoxin system RelE/ParE family toxin [Phycisphaerales bacterium]|nr:type II toxin-antitoxin system RelE/ParE family toxin [Phycisphaerales bacterium]